MSVLDDVAQYLEDQGRGTVGTSIFKSNMPDTPDNIIAVYATGGLTPDRYLPTAEPTFQVMVRASDYATLQTTVDNIVSDLHRKRNVELVTNETYFYYIFLLSEPAHIGRDANGRDEMSINFVTKIRR